MMRLAVAPRDLEDGFCSAGSELKANLWPLQRKGRRRKLRLVREQSPDYHVAESHLYVHSNLLYMCLHEQFSFCRFVCFLSLILDLLSWCTVLLIPCVLCMHF